MAEHTIYQLLTIFKVSCVIAIATFANGCRYNDFNETQPTENEYIAANIDILTLRKMYSGGVMHVRDELIVAGRVTANDRSDNFYRVFMIEDPTGAVEIRAGMFDLHTIFARGRRVAIKLKNLSVSSYNGVLQLGRAPIDGSSQVDYIANRYYPDGYFWPQDGEKTEVIPETITTGALSEDMCGRLVRVTGLKLDGQQADNEYITWADEDETTMRIFSDGAGGEIYVQTSGYSDFAQTRVPRAEVGLTGILMKSGSRYILKIRDLDDVKI